MITSHSPLKAFRAFAAGAALLSMTPASRAITLSITPTSRGGFSSSSYIASNTNSKDGFRGGPGSDAGPSVFDDGSDSDYLEGADAHGLALDIDAANAIAHGSDAPILGRFADTSDPRIRLPFPTADGVRHHCLSRGMFGHQAGGKNDFTAWSPTAPKPNPERFGIRKLPVRGNQTDTVAAETSAPTPKKILAPYAPDPGISLFASPRDFPSWAAPSLGPNFQLASFTMLPAVLIPEPAAPAIAALGALLLTARRRRPFPGAVTAA